MKVPLLALLQFLLCQPPSLPLRPPGALGSVKVHPVQITPGDQHVALGAPWVVEASLLQNDHSIPDTTVKKCTRIAVLIAASPDNPQPGSSAVLPRSGRKSGAPVVPRQGAWMTNFVSPPPPIYVASLTHAPYPPRNTYNTPLPSAALGRKGPLPSSVYCKTPPTESPPPGTGVRYADCIPNIGPHTHPVEQA